MVYNQEYLGTVSSIALNSEYAAVGLDGKVMLHVVRIMLIHLWNFFSSECVITYM